MWRLGIPSWCKGAGKYEWGAGEYLPWWWTGFWHCSLFSPPPSFPTLTTSFTLSHGTGDKPQCSWHPQASILSLQIMDWDPGFEITNLGFSLILPYKTTREEENLSWVPLHLQAKGEGHFGSTDVLRQSLFWPLPRMTQLRGIWDDHRMTGVGLPCGNEWDWNKTGNWFHFPLFILARGSCVSDGSGCICPQLIISLPHL